MKINHLGELSMRRYLESLKDSFLELHDNDENKLDTMILVNPSLSYKMRLNGEEEIFDLKDDNGEEFVFEVHMANSSWRKIAMNLIAYGANDDEKIAEILKQDVSEVKKFREALMNSDNFNLEEFQKKQYEENKKRGYL